MFRSALVGVLGLLAEFHCAKASSADGGSSHGDKSAGIEVVRGFGKISDQNAAFITILQSMSAAARAAQPEMLNGVSVGRSFADWMIFVKAKQSPLTIIKRRLAVRVCADRKRRCCLHMELWIFGGCSALHIGALEPRDLDAEPIHYRGRDLFLSAAAV